MGMKGNRPTAESDAATTIHFQLGGLPVVLSAGSPIIIRFARLFLSDWISGGGEAETAGITSFPAGITSFPAGTTSLKIVLRLVKELPALPDEPPVFVAEGKHLPDGVGRLSVYQERSGFLLYFQDGGLVRILSGAVSEPLIQGVVTTRLLQYGRLHDLLFTSLSSRLRQEGYYLLHASAAVNENGAAIFTGGPGCGKSTTVLNLALNNWGILSNDTLLLKERPDGIYALPTPGGFSIRPESAAHLPALAGYLPQLPTGDFYYLALDKLGVSYAEPARVSTIYFPHISEEGENGKRRLSAAVSLARLLEFSLDRWDAANLPAHVVFLERLSRQAQGHSLTIADQEKIVEMLAA